MQDVVAAHFRLKRPCNNCPFRKTGGIELQPGRLDGIIRSLTEDDMTGFPCHKTTHGEGTDEDEDGNYIANGKEAMCVGAMTYLHKIRQPTVAMRIAFAFGILNKERLERWSDAIIDPKQEGS